MKYLYENQRDDDPVVYEVYSYSKGADVLGNLNWGFTVLKPVYSHDECNMTKGHFHSLKDCAEIYFGIAGQGLLLLMDDKVAYMGWKRSRKVLCIILMEQLPIDLSILVKRI